MINRVLQFVAILRRNGIRVSTAETLDSVEASLLTGLADRDTFKSALRTAMVKRPVDVPVFDGLFDDFFSGLGRLAAGLDENDTAPTNPAEYQELLDRIEELLDSLGDEISPLARALLLNDQAALEKILRELADSGKVPAPKSPSSQQGAVRAAAKALGVGGLSQELERLLEAGQAAGNEEGELDQIRELFNERVKQLGEMLKSLVKLQERYDSSEEAAPKEKDRLLDKSFYYLSPTEIKEMRDAVAVLARRLRNLLALRYKRAKRGRLDVKSTLRHSMEFGGIPFRVRYDRRKRERPSVVVLCDISDSVRTVSRFMLQFVHSLQDMYSRVRSFVFVADMGEVTRLFAENEIQSAIQQAITGDVVNVYAHSNFGRAFSQFHRDQLDTIDGRTTVIVLGDARNNYNAANDWALRDIQQRARRVIWLNPENRSTWGFGDSEMQVYAVHCDVVEECRNLRQLYKVVDLLATT